MELSIKGTKMLKDYMKFHSIISDFRDKLKNQPDDQKITKAEIEAFYDQLDNFDFRWVLFSKYYRKYVANLNRLRPESKDEDPDLTLLRVALAENEWKPTTPFAIFIHHLKYDNKITSKPFIAFQKKQNKKKLNTPVERSKTVEKLEKSGTWTRVPIHQDHSQEQNTCCQGNNCKN